MRFPIFTSAAFLASALLPAAAMAMSTPPGGHHGGGHHGGGHHGGGHHGGSGGSPTAIPEPATIMLLGGGTLGMIAVRRLRRRR